MHKNIKERQIHRTLSRVLSQLGVRSLLTGRRSFLYLLVLKCCNVLHDDEFMVPYSDDQRCCVVGENDTNTNDDRYRCGKSATEVKLSAGNFEIQRANSFCCRLACGSSRVWLSSGDEQHIIMFMFGSIYRYSVYRRPLVFIVRWHFYYYYRTVVLPEQPWK